MSNNKWTVRGVRPETLQRVSELRDEFGATSGALIDEAVEMLYLHMCKTSQMKSVSELASEYSGPIPKQSICPMTRSKSVSTDS